MNKAIIFAMGLVVVGAGVYLMLQGTKGAHLELDGKILKVRALAVGPQATLVVADFRVTNPSNVPFVVETVEMLLEPEAGERVTGRVVSKPQMETVFQALKLIGPKYNDMLIMQDKIPPGATMDRMVAARFEVPSSRIDSRKSLRLLIEDVDGATAEILEGPEILR